MTPALYRALGRDRLVVAAALILLCAIAWVITARLALDMRWMVIGFSGWTTGYFVAMFSMWTVMMAGMMLPSAAPTILLFAALSQGARLSRTGLFAAGYLASWAAFSLLATAAQWALTRIDLLASPMMIRVQSGLAAALFLIAAVYQFTPWKTACLSKCRSPGEYLVAQWRPGGRGALTMGVGHGLYCIGCCWAMMALLFALGAMNLLWVAALAALVLAEKLFPGGQWISRVAAVAMVGAAAALL